MSPGTFSRGGDQQVRKAWCPMLYEIGEVGLGLDRALLHRGGQDSTGTSDNGGSLEAMRSWMGRFHGVICELRPITV